MRKIGKMRESGGIPRNRFSIVFRSSVGFQCFHKLFGHGLLLDLSVTMPLKISAIQIDLSLNIIHHPQDLFPLSVHQLALNTEIA